MVKILASNSHIGFVFQPADGITENIRRPKLIPWLVDVLRHLECYPNRAAQFTVLPDWHAAGPLYIDLTLKLKAPAVRITSGENAAEEDSIHNISMTLKHFDSRIGCFTYHRWLKTGDKLGYEHQLLFCSVIHSPTSTQLGLDFVDYFSIGPLEWGWHASVTEERKKKLINSFKNNNKFLFGIKEKWQVWSFNYSFSSLMIFSWEHHPVLAAKIALNSQSFSWLIWWFVWQFCAI